jgi:fumarylpyruvate hydrolase
MNSTLAFNVPTPALPVMGAEDPFLVRRIYCVGRNYAAHAREMGKDPERELPFFFMKPATALVPVAHGEATIPYPPLTKDFQYEIELVVAVGSRVVNVSAGDALRHVFGYAVGLDMTRRDLQLAARDAGRPWEFGKSFAHSAPVGPLRRASETGQLRSGAIRLEVNEQTRQCADISDLIWSVAECIAYLSKFDPLEPGDLLFTGTPAGVGPVVPGDLLHGAVDGLEEISVRIGPPTLGTEASR